MAGSGPLIGMSLVYGWGLPAGIGAAIWMTARLCRVVLRAPWIADHQRHLLEYRRHGRRHRHPGREHAAVRSAGVPAAASVLLFIAYSLIGVWGVVMFHNRRPGTSTFPFGISWGPSSGSPWLYASANLMVGSPHLHGVVHAAVAAWYQHGRARLFLRLRGARAPSIISSRRSSAGPFIPITWRSSASGRSPSSGASPAWRGSPAGRSRCGIPRSASPR